MEKIILENVQDPVTEESVSPISTKRPRTDWIKNYREKIRSSLSATLQKTNIIAQKNAELLYTSERWYSGHGKPHERADTEITATSGTDLTSSLPEEEYAGSPRALVSVDGCALLLVQDEQPEVTDCDKLGSYSRDDAGGELAKFHTVPDAAPDTSSRPDCKLLLESLEDEPPGGCSLPDGSGDEGAECSVNQIEAFSQTSGEELGCQHGCTQSGTAFCGAWSQSAEAEPCFQKKGHESAATIWCDYSNASLNPNVVEKHSAKLDRGGKIGERKLEWQICENEEVAVSETKGRANEDSPEKNAIRCKDKCAAGSTIDNDVVSSRNIVRENVTLEADVFPGAKGEHAAGQMIAQPRRGTADHTAETPVSARISGEPAEGDNDASPFTVIDPAIWSAADREAVGGCSSQSTAGAELSPSLTGSDMKMPLPLFDITRPKDASFLGQTQQFNHPRGAQQCDEEKEEFGQACSPSANAARLKTGNGGPKCPPVQDARGESIETVENLIEEHGLSGCFQADLENLKARLFQGFESETAKKDDGDEESVGGEQQESGKQAAAIQGTPGGCGECPEGDVSDSSRVLASPLPAHWDAVVPEPRGVNPTRHAVPIGPALNWSDTLSPVPSVFTFGERVPAGFDTFQRIQLSLEDDDKRDCSGSESPRRTSPSQPRQHYHPVLEPESTNRQEMVPEEEDVGRSKCHAVKTTNLKSDYAWNDMPSLTSTPVGGPEQHVERSRSPNGCRPASCSRNDVGVDARKQFDTVLKELRLYFEIGASESFGVGNGSAAKPCRDAAKVPEEETSRRFCSPTLMHDKNPASGKFKEGRVRQYSAYTAYTRGKGLR